MIVQRHEFGGPRADRPNRPVHRLWGAASGQPDTGIITGVDHRMSIEMLGFPRKYPLDIDVPVKREELLLAAIATGKGGDLLGIALPFAAGELVWKLGILDGCIEFDGSGRLALDSGVSRLDPSEKAALAYILSNAQTGLVANRVLGATHVLHLKAWDC